MKNSDKPLDSKLNPDIILQSTLVPKIDHTTVAAFATHNNHPMSDLDHVVLLPSRKMNLLKVPLKLITMPTRVYSR